LSELRGPLEGIRVVEIAGIGPGPFCAMVLSDLGADVIRVDRPASARQGFGGGRTTLERGRRSVRIDLRNPDGVEAVLRLVDSADALIEGFRPGVAERLGIGPDECLARNPRLVYGRMTGWGQDGPLAHAAGHDINYIALAGVLHSIGIADGPPVIPQNLIGDFGGGGMLLALGVACALVERGFSGQGQVVDAAMVDGSALLAAVFSGGSGGRRGAGLLDGGAHFYNVYETSDGEYVAVGSIEPQFYAELLRLTGLEGEDLPAQMDGSSWGPMRERLAEIFRSRTRDEWCALMEGTDVCFAPVLSMAEAKEHPHNVARSTFVESGGVTQAGPAPRFSRTPGAISRPPAQPGEHTDEALSDWGFSTEEIEKLKAAGAIV
jgi:alpha-methylacyl-CoA racemase